MRTVNVVLVATFMLTAGAGCAWGQDDREVQVFDAIGASSPSSDMFQIRVIDMATGAHKPYMSVPFPSGFSHVLAASTLPGNRLLFSIFKDTSTGLRALIVDPLAGSVTDVVPGAPLNARHCEAIEWSPRHNALLVSYGNFGSSATTSIALMEESGAVRTTAAASPSQADLDYVACDATRDIFIDPNRAATNRVVQLATPFPTPMFSDFASPPIVSASGDLAIHPSSGRIYVVYGAARNRLAELVGDSYVLGPIFADGFSTYAFAIVPLPPRIQVQPRADTITCEGGTAVLTLESTGGSPSYLWRKLVGGVWTSLVDGPTGTGSSISGATTPSVSISNFDHADEGEYSCILFDSAAPAGVESASSSVRVCLANVNCDGEVDILDFLDFMDAFGLCDARPAPCAGSSGFDADLNGDTVIDILDFLDFLDAFGQGC
ncbi:MAG: hypothetical protein KF912_06440 [Phycisphaeraceae bacterium]|nr:hypothetical protein [Phycisphaeraceae bacterium]MBX3366938.1 hypothetical protein [Phycisphaeraceae bacterium]